MIQLTLDLDIDWRCVIEYAEGGVDVPLRAR